MKIGRVNKKSFFDNIDLLQIICAYCQINDSQNARQVEFDKLVSYMKVLTQNVLNKEGTSCLSRLYAMFSEKIERVDKSLSYSISDIFVMLIYVYSLIGEECYYGIEEEHRIKVNALSESHLFFL